MGFKEPSDEVAGTTSRENWRYVSNGIYVVRTQAGFKHALRHFCRDGGMDVVGYPKHYPAVVALSYGYRGYSYILAQCVPVNEIIGAINASESSRPESTEARS